MTQQGKTDRFSNKVVENIAILIPSWDGYGDVWPAFFHCLFKYWPDCPFPVFLGTGSRHFPHKRITSLPIGKDIDYSSNLLRMLQDITHEWVIVWVDDFLLSSTVDTSRLLRLAELAEAEEVTSLLLHSTGALHTVAKVRTKIAKLPASAPYLTSLSPAMWKKSDLVRLLRRGENPWQFEHNGTRRSQNSNFRFFGVTPYGGGPPLATVNAIVKGKVTPEALAFFRKEGLDAVLEDWPRLPMQAVLYRKIRKWVPNSLITWWHGLTT